MISMEVLPSFPYGMNALSQACYKPRANDFFKMGIPANCPGIQTESHKTGAESHFSR